jgi:general secretion pathway protein K
MMKRVSIKKTESGAALIAALLIIAIVAAIAGDLMFRSQVDIQRTKLIFAAQQVALDNSYAIAFAQLVYTASFTPAQQKDPNYVPPKLPIMMKKQQLDSAIIKSSFNSAQGLFNINNLSDPSYVPLFAKLIQQVDPDIKADDSIEIANSVAYFIGSTVTPDLEKNYTTLQSPYLPAHHLLASPSELRLIDKVSINLYEKLLPYLIALPTVSSLNPSVAPKAVLIAYGIDSESANAVVEAQGRQGSFKTLNDFYTLAKFTPNTTVAPTQSKNPQQATTQLFTLTNQYFLLTTEIKDDPIDWTIYTLLEADKMAQKLNLIQETRNTL